MFRKYIVWPKYPLPYMFTVMNFTLCANDSYSSGGVGVFVRSDFYFSASEIPAVTCDVLKLSCLFNNYFLCIYRLHSHAVHLFNTELYDILVSFNRGSRILVGNVRQCSDY